MASTDLRWHDQLISPPPAFRSSEPELNKFPVDVTTPLVKRQSDWKSIQSRQNGANSISQDTQLDTKLTRTKRQQPEKDRPNQLAQQQQKKRTMTKFEQSIVAPELRGQDQREGKVEVRSGTEQFRDHHVKGCRFKAQVMFESDTDSMSVSERQSGASQSSRCSSSNNNILKSHNSKRPPKELVSETKYSSTQLSNDLANSDSRLQKGNSSMQKNSSDSTMEQNTNQRVIGPRPDFLEPSWDYSLRVNRMRGNNVDSKVK